MKKRYYIFVALLFCICQIHAQIKKGSWMIGGHVGFSKHRIIGDVDEIKEFEGNYLSVKPEIGYFLTDRFLLGGSIEWTARSWFEVRESAIFGQNVSRWKTQDYSFSPFARYYFTPRKRFKVFYELKIPTTLFRWQAINYRIPASRRDEKWVTEYQFQIKNSVGFDYFLSPNVALEGALSYTYFSVNDYLNNGISTRREYSFPKYTFNPQFGIKLFLNTEKTDSKVLADKYLKKGNVTIGFEGRMDIGDYNSIYVAPSIGYFLTDKWMIGSSLGVSFQKDYRAWMGIKPELRFYQPIQKDLQIILRGATSAGVIYEFYDDKNKTYLTGGNAQVGMGLNKFIAENISIQGLVNLDLGIWKNKLDAQPNIQFGLQYFMNKKGLKSK